MSTLTLPARPDLSPDLSLDLTEPSVPFRVTHPAELRAMPVTRLPSIAAEIRRFLVEKVAAVLDASRRSRL
jgi:hypothetical protein